jgi:hypothetical protein
MLCPRVIQECAGGGRSVNAVLVEEAGMVLDERVTRIESDVAQIRSDLTDVKADVRFLKADVQGLRTEKFAVVRAEAAEFKIEMAKELGSQRAESAKEFGSVRAEIAKEFGLVRTEIADFKADVAKEFGSVRTEMRASTESLKTSIESAKLWMLVTGVSALLLMLFSIVGHALKII